MPMSKGYDIRPPSSTTLPRVFFYRDSQIIELVGAYFRRRLGHQVLRRRWSSGTR